MLVHKCSLTCRFEEMEERGEVREKTMSDDNQSAARPKFPFLRKGTGTARFGRLGQPPARGAGDEQVEVLFLLLLLHSSIIHVQTALETARSSGGADSGVVSAEQSPYHATTTSHEQKDEASIETGTLSSTQQFEALEQQVHELSTTDTGELAAAVHNNHNSCIVIPF